MDWESLSCPNRRCRYYGRPFLQGQLVKAWQSLRPETSSMQGLRNVCIDQIWDSLLGPARRPIDF